MAAPNASGKIRADKYSKLIHRFYEPLILSRVLGQTRGTYISSPQDESPTQARRRRLLRNLSYLCDYDKGGDTTSSIGIEENDQRFVFWVASNAGRAREKNMEFLKASLVDIHGATLATGEQRESLEAQFIRRCIKFAEQRVRKEINLLSEAIRRCKSHFNTELAEETRLAEWLTRLATKRKNRNIENICFEAYDIRKGPEMRLLESMTHSDNAEGHHDKRALAFAEVRHRIGRLAHHVRAPKEVIEDSTSMGHLFDEYDVRLVVPTSSSPRPRADAQTELKGILRRMLPANSPKLEEYVEVLTDMDRKFQITKGILEAYDKHLRPCIHAEIQILEHFHGNKLNFAANDRYIGCSKPACYCCHLYFRHHQSRPVEPESHQKIYLNWGVPDLPGGTKDPRYEDQRDLMTKMLETIRKEALGQIIRQAAPYKWHADSLTGITISTAELPSDINHASEEVVERQQEILHAGPMQTEADSSANSSSYSLDRSSVSSFEDYTPSTLEFQDEVATEIDLDSDSDSDGGVSL